MDDRRGTAGGARLPGKTDRPAPGGGRLRVVVAPDSFKGSLTSVQVAAAIAAGWRHARPADDVRVAPLADGGAGTLDALVAAGGWEIRETTARDPLDRPVRARWLVAEDGRRAFVEMAEASGLTRVSPSERDALRATTTGTGDIIRAVLVAGVRDVVLGVGGSATTDGGAGMLEALGARVTDGGGMPVGRGGAALASAAAADLTGLDARLGGLRLRVACDVTNPLLGDHGAAATYGPQKGASSADVVILDAALAKWADALEAATGRSTRDVRGAGAAGGTTFALACVAERFASFGLVPGVEIVMEEVGLAALVAGADIVITGEGRIDAQTAFGKTALGVARLARDAGIACVALGGGVQPEGAAALAAVGAVAVPVVAGPTTVEAAMAAGGGPIALAAERVARLVTLGSRLGGGDRRAGDRRAGAGPAAGRS